MRFKKGSTIEVLSVEGVPSGAWRSGEILCGNGRIYTVKYDGPPHSMAEIERVPRRVMRPCPPPVAAAEYGPGDIVEVFDNFAWKRAKVMEALEQDRFSVRLIGSFGESLVSIFNIRVRQIWKNDRWTVPPKGSGGCGDEKCDRNTTPQTKQRLILRLPVKKLEKNSNMEAGQIQIPLTDGPNLKQYLKDSVKRSKRSYPRIEPNCGPGRNFAVLEKKRKVDTSFFLAENAGEQCIPATFKTMRTEHCEAKAVKGNQTGALGHSLRENSDANDTESIASSVASCSPTRANNCVLWDDSDSHSSNVESSTESKDIEAEIHRLEVYAYRETLKAFNACGPLTPNHLKVLADLRISLNVSEDEHLMLQRKLKSSGTRSRRR